MRNPERISSICALIKEGWSKMPDIRFGQLIENLKKFIGKTDIFYIEDEEMQNHLKAFLKVDQPKYSHDEICPYCGAYSVDDNVCISCQKGK